MDVDFGSNLTETSSDSQHFPFQGDSAQNIRYYDLANLKILNQEREIPGLYKYPYGQLWEQIEGARNFAERFENRRLKWALWESRGKTEEATPYLDINAQVGRVLSPEYDQELNRSHMCHQSVAWFRGEKTGEHYVKPIDCRKHWCPVCGGRGGKIHNSRKHAVMKRVDFNKYNIRQIVITVPNDFHERFMNRDALSKLMGAAKRLVERFFGKPLFDQKGKVKGYKLEQGAISYLHVFGDEDQGVFKPHVNIHIFEPLSARLKVSPEFLEGMRDSWKRALRGMGHAAESTDIHYSFRDRLKKKFHAVKYMSRPWSLEDLKAVQSDHLKVLLVQKMKGFQYLRFWGALANAVYKDEMDIEDIKKEVKSKVEELLIFLFVAPFNFNSWKDSLEEIEDDFFRIIKGKTLKWAAVRE